MAIITIPKILTDRLTDEGARALAEILKEVEASAQHTTLQIAEERFERKLADAKADIIKWMFIFWVGQIGVLFAFFKH
jgi:lipoate synthase